MKTCEYCGNKVSSNATRCPKCGHAPRKASEEPSTADYLPCRKCGAKLYKYSYRTTRYGEGPKYAEVDTNFRRVTIKSDSYTYYEHTPCPECGEPKPLLAYSETILGKVHKYLWMIPGYLLSIGLLLYTIFYCRTLFHSLVSLVTQFDYHPILSLYPPFILASIVVIAVLMFTYMWAEEGTAKSRGRYTAIIPILGLYLIYKMFFPHSAF